jgi:hypothetical protein
MQLPYTKETKETMNFVLRPDEGRARLFHRQPPVIKLAVAGLLA